MQCKGFWACLISHSPKPGWCCRATASNRDRLPSAGLATTYGRAKATNGRCIGARSHAAGNAAGDASPRRLYTCAVATIQCRDAPVGRLLYLKQRCSILSNSVSQSCVAGPAIATRFGNILLRQAQAPALHCSRPQGEAPNYIAGNFRRILTLIRHHVPRAMFT